MTLNEELNIAACLESVVGWANQVFIIDSASTDATVEIAKHYPVQVVERPFEGYSETRNWALKHLPITTDWVLSLDADERVSPALASELGELFSGKSGRVPSHEELTGYYVKRRLLFMGRWIRRGGYYPVWLLRLYKRSEATWERAINEHASVKGATAKLRNDILHEDRRDLSHWIGKHNHYATLEAAELLKAEAENADRRRGTLLGSQAERKRWIRDRLWNRLPPLLRPLVYFGYRYFLLRGFMDGRAGLVFHFLQGLWFPFLIDAKYLEAKARGKMGSLKAPGK